MTDVTQYDENPTKVVTRETLLAVRCRVSYVDFEGRSDG